jgi:hypothetical protein
MRSGSTMLRLILDSHPNIAIGSETGFMGAAAAVKQIPNWRYGGEWFTRIGWTEDELDARLHEFFGGMFDRFAQQQGKTRWGDKTPFHTLHMTAMAQLFPAAVFVGIVRHPGGTVASLNHSFHYSISQAVRYWTEVNAAMLEQGAALGDRFVLCRYEDLVRSPEPVTRGLMDWLDEPWTPALVEHHKVQRDKRAPRLVDGGTVAHDAIDARRAERWIDELTPADRELLGRQAGPLGHIFGFDTDAVQPAHPLLGSEVDGSLVTGDQLMAHRADWVEFTQLPPEPFAVPPDATLEEMTERAFRAEATLARVRSRRAVRLSESLRRAARDRSASELREAARIAMGRS